MYIRNALMASTSDLELFGLPLQLKLDFVASEPFCESLRGCLGRLPVSRLPLETVFGVFGGFVAGRSRGCWGWSAFGVGLGGGYCTPPNDRDVSVANSDLGSLWGSRAKSYPQANFVRAD